MLRLRRLPAQVRLLPLPSTRPHSGRSLLRASAARRSRAAGCPGPRPRFVRSRSPIREWLRPAVESVRAVLMSPEPPERRPALHMRRKRRGFYYLTATARRAATPGPSCPAPTAVPAPLLPSYRNETGSHRACAGDWTAGRRACSGPAHQRGGTSVANPQGVSKPIGECDIDGLCRPGAAVFRQPRLCLLAGLWWILQIVSPGRRHPVARDHGRLLLSSRFGICADAVAYSLQLRARS